MSTPRSRHGVLGHAMTNRVQRLRQYGLTTPDQPVAAALPDPGLTILEIARQLADDPEFREAFPPNAFRTPRR